MKEYWKPEYNDSCNAAFRAKYGVSRQRLWAIKKQKEGKCHQCGKRKPLTTDLCRICRDKNNSRYQAKVAAAGPIAAKKRRAS